MLGQPVFRLDPVRGDTRERIGAQQRFERASDQLGRGGRIHELGERGIAFGDPRMAGQVRHLRVDRPRRIERCGELAAQDRLGGEIDEVAVALLAFFESVREPPALFGCEHDRDHVRDRRGEALFVEQPIALRPDMLVANHADQPAIAAQRCLQQRRDAERRQIVRGELTGGRIVLRVARRERPTGVERAEVRGVGSDHERGARGVLGQAAAVQAHAAHDLAVLFAQPDAGALGFQLLAGNLGDGPEGFFLRQLRDLAFCQQLEQGGLLAAHAPLGDDRRGNLLHGSDHARGFAGHVLEHSSPGPEPAAEAGQVDDAKLEVHLLTVLRRRAHCVLDALPVDRQQVCEKAFHGAVEGARRVAEQGLEIRRNGEVARLRMPLPEADAACIEGGSAGNDREFPPAARARDGCLRASGPWRATPETRFAILFRSRGWRTASVQRWRRAGERLRELGVVAVDVGEEAGPS